MTAKYITRGTGIFLEMMLDEEKGSILTTGESIYPKDLAHFGNEVLSIHHKILFITEKKKELKIYNDAISIADKHGADYVLVSEKCSFNLTCDWKDPSEFYYLTLYVKK